MQYIWSDQYPQTKHLLVLEQTRKQKENKIGLDKTKSKIKIKYRRKPNKRCDTTTCDQEEQVNANNLK